MAQGELLFAEIDFSSAVRAAPQHLVRAIDDLDDAQLLQGDQQKLLDALVAEHMIAVPVLDLNATKPEQREVNLDLSRDPSERFMRDLTGPYYVKATEVSFRVPFTGDPSVFRCRPSEYTLNPPRADVEGGAVVIRVVRKDQNAVEYRKVFDATVIEIQQNLNRLRADCAGLDRALRDVGAARLAQRREKRRGDQDLLGGLGFGE